MRSKTIATAARLLLAASLLLIGWARPAHADSVVYSNLGTAPTVYDCCTGATISGATSPIGSLIVQAMGFTPSASYDLSQIDVGVAVVSGTNGVTVTLNSNAGGVPGGVLDTWNVTSLPIFGTTSSVLQTLTPASSTTPSAVIALASGTEYWLEMSPAASNTWDAWNFNNTGATGNLYLDDGGTISSLSDATLGAFDVLGASPVATTPEPATWLLLAAGLLGLLAVAARRNPLPGLSRA